MLAMLKQDRIAAMKQKDEVTKGILTVLVGDIENIVLRGVQITDDQVVSLIKKYLISNDEMRKARGDTAVLLAEKAVLEKYLPQQMSRQDILEAIVASNSTNVGQAMAYMKANYAGKYDGKVASEIAKIQLMTV
jgi:uncharacterized protein